MINEMKATQETLLVTIHNVLTECSSSYADTYTLSYHYSFIASLSFNLT